MRRSNEMSETAGRLYYFLSEVFRYPMEENELIVYARSLAKSIGLPHVTDLTEVISSIRNAIDEINTLPLAGYALEISSGADPDDPELIFAMLYSERFSRIMVEVRLF